VSRVSALNVWAGPELVGRLEIQRSGVRFLYAVETVERHGLGIPLISISLPTSARPYPARACLPFFDGLLPEGEARRIIAYDFGLPEADTFALLRTLGRDCAGALAIIPSDSTPPGVPTVSAAKPLTADELADKVRNLRGFPLGVDQTVRVSLGGVQEKLLLTRQGDGWGLPVEGSASTHILKPGRADLPGNVVSEALCLRVAAALGVPAAEVALDQVAGADALFVRRFDREVHGDGTIQRLHQENACQALAVPVGSIPRKYEENGGPSLRQIAALLGRWGDPSDLEMLLRQTAINVLVGNADGHAMNTSILLRSGRARLSPVYDIFSSLLYPISTTLGMYINGQTDIRNVTAADLVAEGKAWGLAAGLAESIVGNLLAAAPTAVETALQQTTEAHGRLGDFLIDRAATLARA
jgi:serine/threonine-protein kinase HipA